MVLFSNESNLYIDVNFYIDLLSSDLAKFIY